MCDESRTHGSERGGWKRAGLLEPDTTSIPQHLAGRLLYFAVRTDRVIEHTPTSKQAGIDVGLRAYYTDSQGNTVANPRHYHKAEKRLKRLQRRLSRTHKKSKNRLKARQKVAKAHLKVARQREDFARKTANALVTSHEPFCL